MNFTQSFKVTSDCGNDYFIPPRVPDGLTAVVESLTREVIRHHPEDIYIFAAHHFEKLVQLRHEQIQNHDNSVNGHFNLLKQEDFTKNPIISLPKPRKSKQQSPSIQHHRSSTVSEVKSPPMLITGMQTKDIKTEMRKNKISSQKNVNHMKNKITTNLKSTKVKDYVIKKFAASKSIEELQKVNYAPKIQSIIDSSKPIINNKLQMIRKDAKIIDNNHEDGDFNNSRYVLEAQLNETCNLLKDISLCFANPVRRPRSADSAANTTDELEAMLNETHNLLMGISTNFFKDISSAKTQTNNNNDSENNLISSLPAVKSPVTAIPTKSINKNNSTFALPPVIVNSAVENSKFVKTKQDLILPELTIAHENKSNDLKSVEVEKLNEIQVPKDNSYILTEANFNETHIIPDEVTTVIISESTTTEADSTESDFINEAANLFGPIVVPTPDEELPEPLHDLISKNNKLKIIKQDLQCINEEEVTEETMTDIIDTRDELIIESVIEELNNTEDESAETSAKETSATDGPIEVPPNFQQNETGPSSSVSTDMADSSNEAKETTLTDGISLSLDDLSRPFVPELNLDSLQDLTVSSFKITETEYEQVENDNEDTNSITESSTVSLCRQTSQEDKTTPCETNKEAEIGNEVEVLNETPVIKENIAEDARQSPIIDVKNAGMDLLEAVTVLQAGIRGFLARRRLAQSDQHADTTNFSTITLQIDEELSTEPEITSSEQQDVEINETIECNETKSAKLKKRLCRENAMQQSSTVPSIEHELTENTTAECGLQHTGEFHDCIPLPMFDIKQNSKHTSTISSEAIQQETSFNKCETNETNEMELKESINKIDNEHVQLITSCDSNNLTLSPLDLSIFQLHPNFTGIINVIHLADDEISLNQSETSITPSEGVIIEEIQDTPEIIGDDENTSNQKKIEEIVDSSSTCPIPPSAMADTVTTLQITPISPNQLIQCSSVPDIRQSPFIMRQLFKSSLSLSQEYLSLLLADERIESPITMMQMIPLRSDSINGNKTDVNKSLSQSTASEEEEIIHSDGIKNE